ncbi:GNAT family N-acetyltransferase [Pseudoxanthomonas sp. X-1]|uniref:GNAT family N-acetyltransferase n=1 Tax=Pseudoxanthomonas sp. X-1 TaxID=2571115 RepID=UPI00110A1984|nr:GNAT family N-acetyltransferase [Pseudoxanthomonas sp. X-1]TMN18468.1 GNAT family N-acetyltransferase [Pseudoxanthomonas sp. X-1]UAY76031.1 GNAT family N-acetyltransferase [Pseudoxanthomonas sp. X-1]
MIVRKATHDDVPAILAMGAAFFAASGYGALTSFDPDHASVVVGMMIGTGTQLVAEHEGALVGMAGAVVAPHTFNFRALMAHEVMLWAMPEARGLGVGRALFKALDAACEEAGAVGLQMLMLENSPPHVADLYEAEGFRPSESAWTKRYT